MNTAKQYFQDVVNKMPDDISFDDGVGSFMMLAKLRHSIKDVEKNGTISEEEMDRILDDKFRELRENQQ